MTELQVTFSHSITKDYYHEVSYCSGLTSWRAGECLSSWLDSQPDLLSGRSVLELGSGSGITGIFAVKRVPHITSFTFNCLLPGEAFRQFLWLHFCWNNWQVCVGSGFCPQFGAELPSFMVGLSLDTANTGQTGLVQPFNTNITTYIAPHQTQLTAEGAVGTKK